MRFAYTCYIGHAEFRCKGSRTLLKGQWFINGEEASVVIGGWGGTVLRGMLSPERDVFSLIGSSTRFVGKLVLV